MARNNFHHPFQPYDIQLQFMEALYDCIERGGVGIFESPTGTGKSLSLICASLTWLRDHKRKTYDEALAAVEIDDDEPQWMVEHAMQAKKDEIRRARVELETQLERVREQDAQIRKRQTSQDSARKRYKADPANGQATQSGEDDFVLDDYDSEDDSPAAVPSGKQTYSKETAALMQQLGLLPKPTEDQTVDEAEELKVLFCSRTHSQLSQLAGELKRVQLPGGIPRDDTSETIIEPLRQISLGSRRNLCVNSKVASLGEQTAINERCVELQQPSVAAERRCNFLPTKDDVQSVLDFRNHALSRIRDIEDLAKLGSKMQICPYYASRSAIPVAEVVTLPYPLLLQKTARQAMGINLKGHVVIIDEAHNILDAIEGIYSTQISSTQLQQARDSLMVYLRKFRNRLKGSNRVYLTQVVRVIDSLLDSVTELLSGSDTNGVIEPGRLLRRQGVDQVNLVKLVKYMTESKLARKVEGYRDSLVQSGETSERPGVPTLTQLQNFLFTLMNPSNEGRFFWSKETKKLTLSYLLLDPSEHFREIVNEARAVILAGGTMSPMADYQLQLVPYLKSLTTFSCGHLIPPESLFVRAVSNDKDGRLDFSFKGRNTSSTALRIGAALSQIAACAPNGMVVFFPSYSFLEEVVKAWRHDGSLDSLERIKPVFLDERGSSAEAVFAKYQDAAREKSRGALLISVIGGKLSEGINFSDELGRCVVVVGLPFPNLETPQWKAKLQYIDDRSTANGEASGKMSREIAENVCMRSVNQAIGRVIRHKNDWASIILLDHRYAQARIASKLPGWIKDCLPKDESRSSSGYSITEASQGLKYFFSHKRATS